MTQPFRHAAYFAPALQSQAWALGSQWLGRCAHRLIPLQQPQFDHLGSEWFENLTRSPRLYGWHATLKAPFELKSNARLDELQMAFQLLAQKTAGAFHLPLKLVEMGGFLRWCLHNPAQICSCLKRIVCGSCIRSLYPCQKQNSREERVQA